MPGPRSPSELDRARADPGTDARLRRGRDQKDGGAHDRDDKKAMRGPHHPGTTVNVTVTLNEDASSLDFVGPYSVSCAG